jgi:hypothetical protein
MKSGLAYVLGQQFKKTYEVAAILMLLETKYLPLGQVQDLADSPRRRPGRRSSPPSRRKTGCSRSGPRRG